MEAQNIAQRYAIFFFTLNSVTVAPQHMGYFSRPLEMMQCQEHKPFCWHKMFSEGRNLVEDEQRSAADDHQQHGKVKHSTGKRTYSI